MKKSIILSAEDQRQLRDVLEHKAAGHKPTEEEQEALGAILSAATEPSSDEEAASWVGLGDLISLVSPKDSSDYFNLRIVLPAEASPDDDLVSVLFPISLAAIGRRSGENVSWETPRGVREMRIVAVSKAERILA